ncbi:MAG TPA: hypothetical protein VFY63_06300, partial [Pseudorhizobium sp.]|nr:hypothetical protein [Pseudorhizobium sp.]
IVRTRYTEGSDAVAEWPEEEFLAAGFGPKRIFVPEWILATDADQALHRAWLVRGAEAHRAFTDREEAITFAGEWGVIIPLVEERGVLQVRSDIATSRLEFPIDWPPEERKQFAAELMDGPLICPVCDVAFKPNDLCASDIELGTCHAECLEGCPIVDLNTGEPLPDAKPHTYPASEIMDPPPASHVRVLDADSQSLLAAQNNVIDGLMAENEKLRKALEPFARFFKSELHDLSVASDATVFAAFQDQATGAPLADLSIADVRQAYAAFTTTGVQP